MIESFYDQYSLPAEERLLVAYSGGKDSLAVLDLCIKAGKEVAAFFMYFLPDLDYTAFWCEYVEKRWKIKVRQYQHWVLSTYLRSGIFRPTSTNVHQLKNRDIEHMARRDSGIEWTGYGFKKSDSLQRAYMLTNWKGGLNWHSHQFAPIKDWSQNDVKSYLTRQKIDFEMIAGSKSCGISLLPKDLEYMRDNWPGDYKKILKVFPYAAAQADRAAMLRELKSKNKMAEV